MTNITSTPTHDEKTSFVLHDRKVKVTYATEMEVYDWAATKYASEILKTDFDMDALAAWVMGNEDTWFTLQREKETGMYAVVEEWDSDDFEVVGSIKFHGFGLG